MQMGEKRMKKVEAFKCDYCHRCFGRPVDATNHERACQGNPVRRACKTCKWSGYHTITDADGINGLTWEHQELWCNHPDIDRPMSDKPYFEDCDFENRYNELVPIPGTCEHYEQKSADRADGN